MKEIIVYIVMSLERFKSNWMGTLVTVILLPVFIIGYAFISQDNYIGKIAIYNGNQEIFEYLSDNNIIYQKVDIKDLEQKRMAESGEFLGYIKYDFDGNVSEYGSFIKKGNFVEQIAKQTYEIETGSSNFLRDIFPVLVTIIFLESVLNMKLYLEDRHNGMLARLRTVGMKNHAYCLATLLYNVLFMFIPILVSFLVIRYGLKMDCGYPFIKMILFLGVTVLLSSLCAFSLCSAIPNGDSAIMAGNILAVITSMVSGVFGEWDKIKIFSNLMPQKILVDWMISFKYNNFWNRSIYVVIVYIVILYFFVLFINNRRFAKK